MPIAVVPVKLFSWSRAKQFASEILSVIRSFYVFVPNRHIGLHTARF
jgi:hypothetical protein